MIPNSLTSGNHLRLLELDLQHELADRTAEQLLSDLLLLATIPSRLRPLAETRIRVTTAALLERLWKVRVSA